MQKEKRNLNISKKQGLVFIYATCPNCKHKETYATSAKALISILKKNNAFTYPNTKEQNDKAIKEYKLKQKEKEMKKRYRI